MIFLFLSTYLSPTPLSERRKLMTTKTKTYDKYKFIIAYVTEGCLEMEETENHSVSYGLVKTGLLVSPSTSHTHRRFLG
jgi:hypothetical protein